MASFPIFVDLASAKPLVVGGGHLALAKVRLLLKRATHVDVAVAAATAVPELRDLVSDGRVTLLVALPGEADIRGRPLVISATGDDAEDARVSAIAHGLGVPVNVPDRPQLCTFALGALVDRGGVTIAIGTEGAAPVLATQLRARLGRELHPRLGRLADIAREFRPAVAETLAPGAPRRAFWDDVFSGPAVDAILGGGEEIDVLRASGIDVKVIPGITAATAVAASLQIPLTHRDIARSVTFISGHAAGDVRPEFDQLDFAALAGTGATLAVYMGLATSGALAEKLIASGWSVATPVIAVATDAPALAKLEGLALAAVENGEVTAVYAFDVRLVDGVPEPISVRETIRAAHAPTV